MCTATSTKIILLAGVLCATMFDMSDAAQCSTGTCANVVVHKAAVVNHEQAYVAHVIDNHHAQQLVSNHVYYFVGAPVRAEALVEEAKHADPEYQEFLQFKEWRARLPENGSQPPAEPQPGHHGDEPPRFSQTASVIQTSCISCHSGASAKGGLDLSLPISEEKKWRMFMRAGDGSMPPENPLSDEKLRELVIELSELGD